jgi:hypothetical protein
MANIYNSLLVQKDQPLGVPLLFLRYSPNGTVFIDGQKKKILRRTREEVLINFLKDVQNEKIKFIKPMNIIYFFYNMKNGKPEICLDAEYDSRMYECVCFEHCKS